MSQENSLESLAGHVLEYLKTNLRYDDAFLPRPFFIEITGSPSAGKTVTINELDKFFRRLGFRVLRPQEGAQVIRHLPRTTPLYNIRTGLYALSILIDESFGHLYDVVIFDRCIFDAYCWMMYWSDKEKISKEERGLIQSFFLSRFWTDKIDAAYFMVCDPDTAIRRELRTSLSDKLGDTTSPANLKILIERYKRAHADLSRIHPQLFLIDTTHMNERDIVREVAKTTLRIMEAKTSCGSA